MPEELPEASPARGRTLRRAIALVVALCVLGGLCLVASSLWDRSRLQRALRAIEQRGEPVVLPASEETQAGRAARAWLQPFGEAEGEVGEWTLDGAEGIARFLELPEGRSLDPQARAQIEKLRACVGDDGVEAHVNGLLKDGVRPERWNECDRAFLSTRVFAFPRVRELLAAPIPGQPLDPRPGTGLDRVPDQLPCARIAERALIAQASARLASGEAVAILSCEEKALQVAALFDRQAGLIASQSRTYFRSYALLIARIALAQLPPDAGLEPMDGPLAGIEDERAQFRRALLEERAMGNECYAQIARSGSVSGLPKVGAPSAWLGFDQLAYLSTFGQMIEIAERGRPKRIGAELEALGDRARADVAPWSRLTLPVANRLLPRPSDTWSALREQRAWIDLVRLGLRVRRMSVVDARNAVSDSTDSFGDGPYHAREESDGLLAIWSVGRNGRNDGAPSETEFEQAGDEEYSLRADRDDLVVRVRMR